MDGSSGSVAKEQAKAPQKPIRAEDWGDLVGHMGQMMVDVTQLGTDFAAMRAEQAEIRKRLTAQDEKVSTVVRLLEQQNARLEALQERLERPVLFKGGQEFYATFSGRIGEEVRASIRAEVGGVAQQVYAAVDAHMKQNPIKLPAGSGLVPFLTALAAGFAGFHVWMSYQAAKNYVPVDVKVNGIRVPTPTVAPSSSPVAGMNGHRHPMARAA